MSFYRFLIAQIYVCKRLLSDKSFQQKKIPPVNKWDKLLNVNKLITSQLLYKSEKILCFAGQDMF